MLETEHHKLSHAIHTEQPGWRDAMKRISDEMVHDYVLSFPGRGNEPRIRVWKRIVVHEAHRRGLL